MRAAAIFGLGLSVKDLAAFQKNPIDSWLTGFPPNSGEADAILVFGGDGTIHRHLEKLVKLQLPLLVVPCGSGNDFARALKLRRVRDSIAAWHKFSAGGGNMRRIDLGIINPIAGMAPAPQSRYFCCVGGVGLDAEVARRANDLPSWLRRHGGYVLSLLPALWNFAATPMKIAVPDPQRSDKWVTRSASAATVAAFANAPSYGGGMKIAPRALLHDGLLDICVVRHIHKFKLLCLFPAIYFGRHLKLREVEYFQANRLKLETDTPLDVYADGEYVCRTPIEVGLAPGALSVIVP